ncbi:MAG: hypothetical protein WAR77_14400 [Saprospiraceae bacterium]|nr:hypothetical protein [Saprospiraceae bacterium]MBK8483419.1 hypothetical protein [Saprospiraceae bacterium]MBK9220929.1 hypothetical protein [Saprospiraceae bacterium]MBK9729247.1 hypothetical protein [Saprospiraceae bacterium]
MNTKVKGLVIILVNILILVGVAILWMNSIRQQRILKSQGLKIQIFNSVSSETLLEKSDILNWLNEFYKKDIRKIPAYSLNLKKLEEYLLSQELVKRADTYLDAKDQLHVDIYQRNPLVRIMDKSGHQYFLDEDGFKISVSQQYSTRIPVATGNLTSVQGKKLSVTELSYYKGLLDIAKAIRKDTFANSLIEQIDLDENGEFTLIPKIGNEQIFIGSSEIIEDKLDRLKLFYKENMGRQGWNYYKLVNLKFKGQIIGKKIQQES